MLNFLKRLMAGISMLMILIGCSTVGSPSLKMLPKPPVVQFQFGTCTSPVKTQAPCLDQSNAQRFVEYMYHVEAYIKMVEELRK